jgi:copper chaperone CopZ
VNTLVYIIPAVSCQHCVHTIKMEVGEIPGVKSVEGDPQTKQFTFVYEPPATPAQIEQLLKEINYPPAH